MKENFKREKGITLIALIITIIILLILAAISVGALTGDEGLFSKAKEAKTKNFRAQVEEAAKIAYSGLVVGEYEGSNEEANLANVIAELEKQGYEIKEYTGQITGVTITNPKEIEKVNVCVTKNIQLTYKLESGDTETYYAKDDKKYYQILLNNEQIKVLDPVEQIADVEEKEIVLSTNDTTIATAKKGDTSNSIILTGVKTGDTELTVTVDGTEFEVIPIEVKNEKLSLNFVESSSNTGTVTSANGEYTLTGQAKLESQETLNLTNFSMSVEVKNLSEYHTGNSADASDYERANSYNAIIGVGEFGSGVGARFTGMTYRPAISKIVYLTGSGDSYNSSTSMPTDTNWHKLTMIWNGSECKTFYDGGLVGTVESTTWKGGKLYIGGFSNSPTVWAGCAVGFANGTYRNIEVYDYALND